MTNRRNASQQATGYVLVRIEDTSPPIIIIGFVETTLDRSDEETPVDLLVVSFKRCASIWNINWSIQPLKSLSMHFVFDHVQHC